MPNPTTIARRLMDEFRGATIDASSNLVPSVIGHPTFSPQIPAQESNEFDLQNLAMIDFKIRPYLKLELGRFKFSLYNSDYETIKTALANQEEPIPVLVVEDRTEFPGWFYLKVNPSLSEDSEDFSIAPVDILPEGFYTFTITHPDLNTVIGRVEKAQGMPIIAPTRVRINDDLILNINLWEFPDRDEDDIKNILSQNLGAFDEEMCITNSICFANEDLSFNQAVV